MQPQPGSSAAEKSGGKYARFLARIFVATLLLGLGFSPARTEAASSTEDKAILDRGRSNSIVVEKNPLNVATNSRDSLTERGSYNFSDMGSWIWGAVTRDRQTCRFWKSFEIPDGSKIARARLRITGDNEYILYLDGRELGRDAEWRHLYEYDITDLLSPGRHILAVEVYNSFNEAGMILGLRIGLADGRVVSVKSDASWVVGADDVAGWENVKDWQKMPSPPPSWPAATVIAPCGSGAWAVSPWYIDIVPPLSQELIPFWKSDWFQITALVLLAILFIISFFTITQLALRVKEQRLLQVERARIARDIHDDLGMRMTQLVLQGEMAKRELPLESGLHQQLVQICEDARDALRAMDEVLWAISPRRDNLREFASYVCKYANTFLKASSMECVLDVDPELPALAFDLPLRRTLLLAVKEALNNAAKYSQATKLTLHIHVAAQNLIVVVEDNGRGFDSRLDTLDRNGLINLKQRMVELGGSCSVISQPGQGCRVELILPILRRRPHFQVFSWIQKAYAVLTPKPLPVAPQIENPPK